MKNAVLCMFALSLLLPLSCGGKTQASGTAHGGAASSGKPADSGEIAAVSAATRRRGPTVRELLDVYMPEQMADGIVKVAIVRSLALGDHTRQFLESCVAEGRAMGFTVDVFAPEGGGTQCRELIARISRADYDGLICSYGCADFSFDYLRPAIEKGIKVVTYDAGPFNDGASGRPVMGGLTSTVQDDAGLARISLEALLSRFGEGRPLKLIRVRTGPGIPPLDRREEVYREFIRAGKIEEAAVISPRDFAFARGGTREALMAALPAFPPGSVDAIWAPYDEFAKGCADALSEAGRTDIKLASIGISNDNIKLMLEHSGLWLYAAAADPALIGIINMRLLAAKFSGGVSPASYRFDPYLVETRMLNHRVSMANIAAALPGWKGERGFFDSYPWMAELKSAEGKYLRLPPPAAGDAK